MALGQYVRLQTLQIAPAAFPDELFDHYSIPAFDESRGAATTSGAAIESGKFLLSDPAVLVSKLNPRKMRVQTFSGGSANRAVASTEFMVYVPREDADISIEFLAHLLGGNDFARKLQAAATGTTNSHVRVRPQETLSWTVRVPPLEEQRRIAEALDTIDENIQATERILLKLLRTEQGLRRDLLEGKFDRARPEEWARCRIGEFADVQRGASPRPIDNPAWFSVDGPGWIRISDVSAAGDVLLETRDHLSPAGVARSRRVHPGEVIMSIAATIGVAIVVGIEACYHDGFVKIDHDESVIPEFLVMLLAHHKDDFIRSGQTGTQANINSTIVAETEVQIPSLEVQAEIVSATSSLRAAIRVEEESIRALREIRDGLAADLLSGQVRTVAA